MTYGTILGGAVIGFVTGGLSSALNGGDLGDVLRGAVVGGASGALFGAASGISGGGGIAARGVIGGARNIAMGGKFQDGFISAAATAAVAPTPINSNDGLIQATSKAVIAGVIGGSASSLGGGKFSNGAWTSSFQFLISPTTSRVGAFSGMANGLGDMMNAKSWGQFGSASLRLLGLPSDLFQKWVPSSSGGKVPQSAANIISDAATYERTYNKGFENVNGHHGWHAGTNALAAYRYGLGLGSILQVGLGVAHETIDFSDNAMPAEYKNQGPYNMMFDSVMDIVANTYGMIVGFSSLSDIGAAQFSITTGNWIPGPTDSDPNFNGDGSTYIERGRNPIKGWGQNPTNKKFW